MRRQHDVGGAYVGFAAAIVIWGWHEMSFLMGEVAGPNRAPCPPGLTGWPRFKAATATVIHHELAIAATALALVRDHLGPAEPGRAADVPAAVRAQAVGQVQPVSRRAEPQRRGVPGASRLPQELFPRRADECAVPAVDRGRRGAGGWAWSVAEAAPADSGAAASATLLAGLAILGVVEHLFLVLPLRDAKMFSWAAKNTNMAA